MSSLSEFGQTAKGLAKNPLGIIALFIVLVYGFASLVVGFSTKLEATDRLPIIWFLVLFPVLVLIAFAWLVSCHHEKLYAPKDFTSDEAFIKLLQARSQPRSGLRTLDQQIEQKIKETLTSDTVVNLLGGDPDTFKPKLENAAQLVSEGIKSSSFITVDAQKFTGSGEDVFEFPVSAFSCFNDLTDELYFAIRSHVEPFSYGYSWALATPAGDVIKHARMINGTDKGIPCSDTRTLTEVGIAPGMVLNIVSPR